jgi:hypothetical protein
MPAGQHDPAAGPRVEADALVACLSRRRARSRRRVHLGDLRRDLENILRRFCQTPPRRRSGPSYTECERALLQIVAPEVKRRGSTLCPSARFRRERALPPDHAKRHRRGAMPLGSNQFGSRSAAPVGRGGQAVALRGSRVGRVVRTSSRAARNGGPIRSHKQATVNGNARGAALA